MKAKLVFQIIMLSVLAGQTFAQITLNGNDMPQGGRSNILAYDTSTVVNIGPASGPQTWNFSNLQDQYRRYALYSPVTPNQQYQSIYTGAEIYTYGPGGLYGSMLGSAPVDPSIWGYMYMSSDAQGFKIVGFNGNNGQGVVHVLENPQELLMGTPATYDSVFHNFSRWETRYDQNPADFDTVYSTSAIKTLSCDAFGTMHTPFGTFNVLRVHENTTHLDSATYMINNVPYVSYFLYGDTVNNYYFWAKNVRYPVAVVMADKNNVVKKVEYLKDTIPYYTVTGQALSTNGSAPVTSGTAYLKYRDVWNHLFTTFESVNLVNNGHFQFSVLYPYDYLIFIDPDHSAYPYDIPTYYGNSTNWQTATTLHLAGDTSVAISLQNDSAFLQTNGQGTIGGRVSVAAKNFSTSAQDIKVVLEENPGGATMIHTGTDNNGNYNFANIPDGDYRLRVEIAGLLMDSTYDIAVTQQQLAFPNRNFVYDTAKIYVTGNSMIKSNSYFSSHVKIYPNPFGERCTISVENGDPFTSLELMVYDVSGKEVRYEKGGQGQSIILEKNNLNPGAYLVNVIVNHSSTYWGKLIISPTATEK